MFTHKPQDRPLLSSPEEIISSNSSSKIPRCDANEPILFFYSSKRWFCHKYLYEYYIGTTTSIFPDTYYQFFSSQSRLIRGWNIPLRGFLAISSVIWLEEPLFSDNYIAAAQPDESTGFFKNPPQFFIYLLRCTYESTPTAIMDLRMAKKVSLEVILIGCCRRKKVLVCNIVYNSELITRTKNLSKLSVSTVLSQKFTKWLMVIKTDS